MGYLCILGGHRLMGISRWLSTLAVLCVGFCSTTSFAGIYLYDKFGQFYRVEGQALSGPFGVPKSPREGEVWLPGTAPFIFKDPAESTEPSYHHRFNPVRSRVDTDLSQAIFEVVLEQNLTEGEVWNLSFPDGYLLEQAIYGGTFRAFSTRDRTGGISVYLSHEALGPKMRLLNLGDDAHIARVQSAPLGDGLIISFWGGYLVHFRMDLKGQPSIEHIGPQGRVIDAHVGIIQEASERGPAKFGLVSQVLTDEGTYEFRIHNSNDLTKTSPLWFKIVDKTIDGGVAREVDPMGMVSNDQVYNPDALMRAAEGEGATENLIDWEGRRVLNPPRAKHRKVQHFLDVYQNFKCDQIATGNVTWLPPSN